MNKFIVKTSVGLDLLVPEDEAMFYEVLRVLVSNDLIPFFTFRTAELLMMRGGYYLCD